MASIALYQDPFSPVLTASEPSVVSIEQKLYIKRVLDRACSDSLFADKAYVAITKILKGESVVVPVVNSLNPGSATLGDPSFTLHVMGTGFTVDSKIFFNGSEEPTTYVSATELTTGVDMSTATSAVTVPVVVVSGDGVPSTPVNFVFQDTGAALLGARKSTVTVSKPEIHPPTPSVKK